MTPRAAEAAQEGADNLALAESVVAREEAVSGRVFDPMFRAKAKELLAALPLAELASQTGEGGLGLNSLGDSQADLVYTPVTPCRIIDTRIAGGTIAGGTTRNFLVTGTDYSAQGGSATGCGVPYGPTTAAVVNFVAVNPGGAGNLRVTPVGTAMPLASIINFTAGVNLANGLVVATCNPSSATCSSDITIQADVSTTQLVADVQGYYRNVSTGGIGTALLADAAVTTAKLAAGSVGTTQLVTGAVGTTQLADGSVTSAKIDPTTVQVRVSGTCGPIQAVNQDGTVDCVSGTGLSLQLVAMLRWDQFPRGYGDFDSVVLPLGVAFDGANIWVANSGLPSVTKLRASDGTTLGNAGLAGGHVPTGVAFDGANIWVTNFGTNNVTKMRASDMAWLHNYDVGMAPYGVAFDGANIWVANRDDNTVSKR